LVHFLLCPFVAWFMMTRSILTTINEHYHYERTYTDCDTTLIKPTNYTF